MKSEIESKIDWKKLILPLVGVALIGGMAAGFFARPKWDKARAKKLATKKKVTDKSDTKKV